MALTEKEQELLEIHLPYEPDLLDYAFVEAGADPDNADKRLRRLMAIDCFYMHARNLIEFYQGSVTSEPSRTSAAARFTRKRLQYPNFGDYMTLINDQVTHLNLDRGTNAKETLDGQALTAIKNLLADCLSLFQKNLTDDAEGHWVKRVQPNYFVVSNIANAACTVIYEEITSSVSVTDCVQKRFFTYNPSVPAKMLTRRTP